MDGPARISSKMTGKPSSRLGATHRSDSKQMMSARAMGNKRCVGRKISAESIEKIRKSNILAHPKKDKAEKPVFVGPRKPKGRWVHPEEKQAMDHVRSALKRMLRRVLTMSRVRKDLPTEQLLGYSKDELRRHLESKFNDQMSWSDRGSFHIDHITPVAHFFRRGIYDPAIINALSNLQVLTPEQNRRKSDHITITDLGVMPGIVGLA